MGDLALREQQFEKARDVYRRSKQSPSGRIEGDHVFAAIGQNAVPIRIEANMSSLTIGFLYPGEMFDVTKYKEQQDQPTFLKLADGRGWAINDATVIKEGQLPCVTRVIRFDDQGLKRYERLLQEAKEMYAATKGARYARKDEKRPYRPYNLFS